jgi:hypothetical protein
LGIEIIRDRETRTLSLSQHSYIVSTLTTFNMAEAKERLAPLMPGHVLTQNTGSGSAAVPYQELVGKLMWPSIAMCPDLSNTVTILLQFLTAPTYDHWEAAKGVLHYLKHTASYKLTF